MSIAKIIGQAKENVLEKDERPNDFAYQKGSTQKRSSPRFAGDIIQGFLGVNGPFAAQLNDPAGMKNAEMWAGRYFNGPLGPGVPG